MARVTVEDCLENVANRFELVMVATQRARDIAVKGAEPMVEWENDKPTVVALREIAAGLVTPGLLRAHKLLPEVKTEVVKEEKEQSQHEQHTETELELKALMEKGFGNEEQ